MRSLGLDVRTRMLVGGVGGGGGGLSSSVGFICWMFISLQ